MSQSSTNNNVELIKDSRQALKRISSEHEQLNANYRKERREISKSCADFSTKIGLFDENPFGVIAKKVDDLKLITSCKTSCDEILKINQAAFSLDTSSFLYHSNTLKSILSSCENKCHQVLTQLANVDFILNECEDSLETYHMKMVNSMIEYNLKLNNLYKRRLTILTGHSEPGLIHEGFHKPPPVCIPNFWLQSITGALEEYNLFLPKDCDVLTYLSDIRYYYNIESMLIESMNVTTSQSSSAQSTPLTLSRSSSPISNNSNVLDTSNCQAPASINSNNRSQVLIFIFKDNPYFSDKTLTKKIYIDKSRLKAGQEMVDGIWVTRREGCKINWYEGKDITKRQQQPGNSVDNNQLINAEKDLENFRSFFQFFTDNGFNNYKQIEKRESRGIDLDYQIFMLFRDIIVPHAIVAYCRRDND